MIYTLKDSPYYYFLSKDVKVFPCSYRGTYEVKLGENNSKTYTFDPEARLNTEYNYVTLSGTNGHNSYIKSYNSTSGIVCCVVGGYYFELDVGDLVGKSALAGKSICIVTKSITLVEITETSANYDKNRNTTILSNIYDSQPSLDNNYTLTGNIGNLTDAPTKGYVFTGIVLTTPFEGATASLQLFDSEGQINKKAFLPMLYHGDGTNSIVNSIDNKATGEGSIALGDHTDTSKNHQVVVGKYNDDVDGEFVIGIGDNTTKTNSFVANGDTISIYKNLTIKYDTDEGEKDDYTTFTPDATTIKTKKFTIKDGDNELLVIDNQSDDSKKVEIKNISSTQSITLDSDKAELKHSDASKFNLTSTEATLTAGTTSVVSSIINLGTTDLNTEATINGTLTATGATTISDGTEYAAATNFSDIEAALKVAGGVHIGKKLNVINATTLGSTLAVTGTTNITNTLGYSSSTTGTGENAVTTYSAALKVAGGVHIGEKLNVADTVTMPSLTAESDKVTIINDIHLKEGGYIYNKDKTNTVNILLESDALQATAPTIKANGNLTVGDTTDGGSKTTTLNGTLGVTGKTTSNELEVTGASTLSTTSISGVTNITNTTLYSSSTDTTTNTTTHNAALKVTGGVHIGDKLNVVSNISTTGDIISSGTNKKIQVGSETSNTTITNSSVSTGAIYNCSTLNTGNSNSNIKLYYDNSKNSDNTNKSDWKLANSATQEITLLDKNGLTKVNKFEVTGNYKDAATEKIFGIYTGNQNAAEKFSIDYDGTVYAKGEITGLSFNAYSDRRLKENIVPFKSEKSILDLPIYKYDYIEGTKNNIGCIAQDLQEICPELVSENENGYLSVKESKLVYLLLEEVKILKNKLLRLENSK